MPSSGIGAAGTVARHRRYRQPVLIAAFSSSNAGLYSTGRILRSMSMNGSVPKFTGVMGSGGVPYGGIPLTSLIALVGIALIMAGLPLVSGC